ncbi:MAG: DUF2461 domain-containing protein [Leptolinea sp.]|nr:DUF2461 domain-containing protein [Leptolinea sp.]
MPGFDLQPVLEFTTALKQNNNRPWFMEHREEYDRARARFEEFVCALIRELSKTDPLGGITPKDCIFRLNRDLRFTKDKTPYKPYMSAYIAPGGRKSRLLGYYLHLEPGNVMLAGGFHEPESRQLTAFREAISQNSEPLKMIISDKRFIEFFGSISGERLKTIPRGFTINHPEADLLRLKSITVTRKITNSEVISPGFFDCTLDTFREMKPFLEYLGQFV